jgi:hypothetical protein
MELPVTESANHVKNILKSLPKSLDTLLNNSWAAMFISKSSKAEDVKEMLRCLVLTYEEPTLMELATLVGLAPTEEGAAELRDLIWCCPSFLKLGNSADPKVAFKNAFLKPHLLRHVELILGLSAEGIRWQHGELALRSFAHILERFATPKTVSRNGMTSLSGSEGEIHGAQGIQDDADATGELREREIEGDDSDVGLEDDESEIDPEASSSLGLGYMVKHFLHHASKGTEELAQEIAKEARHPSNHSRRAAD